MTNIGDGMMPRCQRTNHRLSHIRYSRYLASPTARLPGRTAGLGQADTPRRQPQDEHGIKEHVVNAQEVRCVEQIAFEDRKLAPMSLLFHFGGA